MGIICQYCNKEYASYASRSNHIKKYHNDHVHKMSTVGPQSVHIVSTKCPQNNSSQDNNICKYCDKVLCNRKSRWRHEKICSVSQNTLDKIQEENEELKNQITELKNMFQKALKIHPKTLQKINNQLNNNNINNGTINNIIVQLGNENLDEIMTEKEKKAILYKNANCINELIKKVHISSDEKYKKFKNVYITNLQNNIAYKYDETRKKFMAVDKNDLLERLIDCRMFDIESFLSDFRDELEPNTIKVIERFIQKLDDDNLPLKKEKIKEIKLLLYNGRDEILDNIKYIDEKIIDL